MIKKLLLFFSVLPCIMQAGIQGEVTVPDEIAIVNTSNKIIVVDNTPVKPGKTYIYCPDHDQANNAFSIRCGNRKYHVTYPTYNPYEPVKEVFSTIELDFTTLLCLAGDYATINNTNGLDEVCLLNDTVYTIAAVVMLNKIRSNPRMLRPDETISKMVRDCQAGTILLTDENRKPYSLSFPCASSRTTNHNWASITLSAATIKCFGNGFKIKIAR